MNGYNFTERVRTVLSMARQEAAQLHHEYVGTEHILLALIAERENVATTVLENLAVDLDALGASVRDVVKKGEAGMPRGPDVPYTSRAKKVLELSMKEARGLRHNYVGTEHLLLGLIEERKGIAAQVLAQHGVTIEAARGETVRILGEADAVDDDGGFRRPRRQTRDLEATAQTRSRLPSYANATSEVLSGRVRDVMREAEQVTTQYRASELMPLHVAIALVRYGEGMANAIVDRLGCNRPALLAALEEMAKAQAPAALPDEPVKLGQYMIALQRHIDAAGRWSSSPPSTVHVLLALLDTTPDVAAIFDTHGVTSSLVKNEARRISG
jgi:ATP-dependent Clp protease ATP-binding subunit ClpA